MSKHTVICHEHSDVKNFVVGGAAQSHLVQLSVVEADANPNVESGAVPLIAALLLPSQAVALALALLDAAGVQGTRRGNAHTFTFIS